MNDASQDPTTGESGHIVAVGEACAGGAPAPQASGRTVAKRERLAILLTVYNRRVETIACLERIGSQVLDGSVEVDVMLVDDGSTDGTAAAVRERWPEVEVIAGSGDLYWNGGMRMAFGRALGGRYDFYLLLNDDTHLYDTALASMLQTYRQVALSDRFESIVVGSTQDPRTGALSYGGWRSVGRFNPADCVRAEPGDHPQRCDTMNANCVLIPRTVAERVGNLDAGFTHGMGDWDYGFRARRAGCALWLAPGFVGTCAANPGMGWRDPTVHVRQRWGRLIGRKGLPPREWLLFTCRHSGLFWPVYWVNPYVRFWVRALAGWMGGGKRSHE